MKILQVADRPGWAIDRLSKPLSEIYENVDMSYFNVSPDRYLDSGYSDWKGATHYTLDLGNKYDIIHFHRLEPAVMGIDKLKDNIRRIITVHTERHEDYDDERLMLFDDIICPTKYAYDRLEKNLALWQNEDTKIHQVAYGIDLSRYKRATMPHHVPHGIDLNKYKNMEIEPVNDEVGYVGRLVNWKRYSEIQKAVHDAGMKLSACGYIEHGKLQNVHNLKEGEDFHFYIFLPEPMMPYFYSRMILFICLSEPHIEAGPLPIMEAMACEVPVISTKVGWATDHCEHLTNIYFIEQDEIDKLTSVIKMLKKDVVLRNMIARGGKKLIQDFSIEKYAENLMKIYEQS